MLCNKQTKLNICILLAAMAVGLVCASSAVGATLNVPSATYPTIQSAIDAAVNGDTVQVAAGTYAETLDWETKSIALIGAGSENTIVDVGANPHLQANPCLWMYQVPDTASVEGFTFTRGFGAQTALGLAGGGVYLYESSPTITNCIISNNSADYGGGLYIYRGSPSLINNIVSENEAVGGGGILLYESDATVTNNIISGNSASRTGGGLVLDNSSPTLIGNTITGNISGVFGGGLYIYIGSPSLINNIVSGNSAGEDGGGMYIDSSCDFQTNNTITANTGGGIYDDSQEYMMCLAVHNIVINCILWDNSNYDLKVVGQPLLIRYSAFGELVGTIKWPEGNISDDPMFVNPSAGDYHLRADSPCIDKGTNATHSPLPVMDWPLPETDFDGNPRVVDGDADGTATVDMGAYEAIVGWTPSGPGVVVKPQDPVTGRTPVTLTFDDVTGGGVTTVTSTTPSEEQGAPEGFKFGNPPVIYEISTTATFTGPIEVCFDYSGANYGNESNLKLFHREGSSWVDVTTSVDTVNKIICGTVTDFSFFGAFESEFVDPVVLLGELAGKVFGLNLQNGIENSLDAKLDAALGALDDVNNNNDVAAINTLQAFINAVEAQRGNKILDADADDLIATAQGIIAALTSI